MPWKNSESLKHTLTKMGKVGVSIFKSYLGCPLLHYREGDLPNLAAFLLLELTLCK